MEGFSERIKVEQKDLIPRDALEKCLWVMKATAKAYNFGHKMQDKGKKNEDIINYNYSINEVLGNLEYDFREGRISKEEFEKSCKEVYERFDINFDVIKSNLEALEKAEENDKKIKEYEQQNYYKYEYDEEGNRKQTELDIETQKHNDTLLTKLDNQTQKYIENKRNKEKSKDTKKEIGKGERQ